MALSHLVVQYESNFCTVALQFMEEEKNYPLPSPATTGARGRGRQPGASGQSWRRHLRCARRRLRWEVLAVSWHSAEWKGQGAGRLRPPPLLRSAWLESKFAGGGGGSDGD